MEVQITLHSHSNPIVVTCPQGAPRFEQAVVLNKEGDELTDKKSRKIIKLSNKEMVWAGRNEPTQFNTYVGVLEGASVGLHPTLFQATLLQQIQKQNQEYQSKNSALESGLTQFEQQKLVAEELGTSKSRRKMRQLETNRVKAENITGAESTKEKFESKKQEIEDQIEIEKQVIKVEAEQSKIDLLPEFQRGEKQVQLIYNVKSIISDEDMENLDIGKLQVYLGTKQEDVLKHYSAYIVNLIKGFTFEKANKTTILKYLEYIEILLKLQYKQSFHNQSIQEIAQDLHVRNVELMTSILTKFYQKTQGATDNSFNFSRSQFLKDKYTCYIIVLHLIIFRFKFDAAPLAKQLSINLKKMAMYCKECGCKCENRNSQLIAQLKAIK